MPSLEFIILVLLAINILVFYLYNKLLKDEAIKHGNELLAQQNDAYQKQAALIQEFQKSIHDQRHDLNHHLSAMKGLAEQQQTDDLLEYIYKLSASIQMPESGISCGNAVIDAMVNSKLYLAAQQNTRLNVRIDSLHIQNCNPIDLTIILGNLLDNALEACSKLSLEERDVWLDISCQHGVLSIEVANTCDMKALDIRDGKIYSTKKDGYLHGIGLNHVRQAVEKYNGIFEYNVSEEGGKSLFTALAMLYLLQSS